MAVSWVVMSGYAMAVHWAVYSVDPSEMTKADWTAASSADYWELHSVDSKAE